MVSILHKFSLTWETATTTKKKIKKTKEPQEVAMKQAVWAGRVRGVDSSLEEERPAKGICWEWVINLHRRHYLRCCHSSHCC